MATGDVAGDVSIVVFGPEGLEVSEDPRVSSGGKGPRKILGPPEPGNTHVVLFKSVDDFHEGLEHAVSTARTARDEGGQFGIVIDRTGSLSQHTLDLVGRIADEAGLQEVPIRVRRLD
jgi:hypothetical protein